jgi:hypothetical protein
VRDVMRVDAILCTQSQHGKNIIHASNFIKPLTEDTHDNRYEHPR